MLGNWNDFDRTFAAMDQLRRRMEQTFDGFEGAAPAGGIAWPRVTLWDTGAALALRADLPGVRDEDLNVTLTRDVLTVSGRRKTEAPSGYSAHRQERLPLEFSRSFTLPCKVNGDEIDASLKDGVLTITMPKTPDSQPRQITVKAG